MDELFEDQMLAEPVTIPDDPGFNEEAWQKQLLVDLDGRSPAWRRWNAASWPH